MSDAAVDLVTLLHRATARHASRPLFTVDRGGRWSTVTFARIARDEVRLRAALARLGVGAGDAVAIVSKNREEWPVVLCATLGLGATLIPMYEVQHASDWRHILRDSRARVCFASTGTIYDRVRALLGELPELAHVVAMDARRNDATSFKVLVDSTHPGDAPLVTPSPDDVAAIIYTSGTTGTPKGVRLSHRALAFEMNALGDEWRVGPSDRLLSVLPWAHVGGFCELLLGMDRGVCVALPSDLARLGEAMRVTRPTVMIAVPRVWHALHDAVHKAMASRPPAVRWVWHAALVAERKRRAGVRPSRGERLASGVAQRAVFPRVRARLGGQLRYGVSGAAALSPRVAETFETIGIPMYEVYGQTETSAVATANRPGACKLGTVGRPLRGVRVEIDCAVAATDDGSGEVILHTDGAMLGYHDLPEETAAVLRDDGAVRTGDLGRLDAEGYLVLTGRLRDVYKLENGKFVSPVPIEDALTQSPFIAQAMVWGLNKPHNVALLVADEREVRAWCVSHHLRPGGPLVDEPRVRDLLAREISARTRGCKGYERIAGFEVVMEPFTTENGLLTPTLKLKRGAILARYRERIEALYS